MGLDGNQNNSIRDAEKANVLKTSTDPTTIRQTICSTHRRIGIWRGRHTLTRGRNQPPKTLETTPPPHRVLLGDVHANRKKLRHLRKGTPSSPKSPTELETTPRMDATPLHPHHRSC